MFATFGATSAGRSRADVRGNEHRLLTMSAVLTRSGHGHWVTLCSRRRDGRRRVDARLCRCGYLITEAVSIMHRRGERTSRLTARFEGLAIAVKLAQGDHASRERQRHEDRELPGGCGGGLLSCD